VLKVVVSENYWSDNLVTVYVGAEYQSDVCRIIDTGMLQISHVGK